MLQLIWITIKRSWKVVAFSILAAAARIFLGKPEGPVQTSIYQASQQIAHEILEDREKLNRSRRNPVPDPQPHPFS